MVKKTGIITDLEKNTGTVAYCASTAEFSKRSTKNFSGKGSFLESVHFDKYLSYNTQKWGAAGKNFRVFTPRYS